MCIQGVLNGNTRRGEQALVDILKKTSPLQLQFAVRSRAYKMLLCLLFADFFEKIFRTH